VNIAHLRTDCKRETLDEAHVDCDPCAQFGRWLDAAESDTHFAERPRLSRLGARASPPSHPVDGRAAREACFAAAETR
jgi:pyridoxine/pyridoxamine 5'-phosphate oxidase